MNNKLNCIMLVDDDQNDNFFHEREIRKSHAQTNIITKNSGIDALKFLESKTDDIDTKPDLIFLDINMPCMNGWEFLQKYSQLDKEKQCRVTIVMLSTAVNPVDLARTKQWNFISDYIFKPLTKEKMEDIIEKYFK